MKLFNLIKSFVHKHQWEPVQSFTSVHEIKDGDGKTIVERKYIENIRGYFCSICEKRRLDFILPDANPNTYQEAYNWLHLRGWVNYLNEQQKAKFSAFLDELKAEVEANNNERIAL